MEGIHAVTGAHGYSGRHIASMLLDKGVPVRSLTGHAGRPDPFGGRVQVVHVRWDDAAGLRRALEGVSVLVNTYWVRFEHGATTFALAVDNSRRLWRAAAEAGVARVVHTSITNPSEDSPLPYFRGKALVERALRESGLPHSILRPAVFFGGGDVLVNNIAYLLRRLPAFGLPPGDCRLRPVHVDDFARLAVSEAAAAGNVVRDAAGPEQFAFAELVRLVARAVGSRSLRVRVPKTLLHAASRVVGRLVGDVVLTRDEIDGLCGGLLASNEPPAGTTLFSAWLREAGPALGREWAGELARHFV